MCVCLVALSCQIHCDPVTVARQALLSMGILQARILEQGCHALLQGIVSTQGSTPSLLHSRQILYHLSLLTAKMLPFLRPNVSNF